MKKVKIAFVVLLAMGLLSSCASMKKNKCSCPKFTEEPIPIEQPVVKDIDA